MAKRARKQVDAAVVQQAMAALGITAPVRAWKEEGGRGGRDGRTGRLVLLLATGERVVCDWQGQGRQDAGAPKRKEVGR